MSNTDELEDLRAENAAYHKQLQELNEQMDRMLLKRDKPQKGKQSRDERPVELRQLAAKNEQLRKERLKWWAEVTHSDTAVRIADTRNEVALMEKKILEIKEDIRGLENIKKAQQQVVDIAKHATDEVKYLQQEHRQEVSEYREELRKLNEENKHSEKTLAMWQARYHGAVEKTKLGVTGDDVEALRQRVDSQGTKIEELRAELDEKTESARGKRREGHKEMDAQKQEREDLQRQLEAAKQILLERDRELKLSYARSRLLKAGAIEA